MNALGVDFSAPSALLFVTCATAEKASMIEASIGALDGLIPIFVLVAIVFTIPVLLWAKAKKLPMVPSVLWSISLAGALVVTLTPGGGGFVENHPVCYIGPSAQGVLSTVPGQLNVALFVPVSLFAVVAFRKPILALAGGAILTCGVELLQAVLPLGRSCSYSDIAANAMGVVAGVLLGTGWVWWRSRRPPITRRDSWQAAGLLGIGGSAMGAMFLFVVTPAYGGQEAVGATAAQGAWARQVAAEIYGDSVDVIQVQAREAIPGFPGRVDVTTAKGSLTLLWPDKKIQTMFANDNKDDGGSLTRSQVEATGLRFAQKWFPGEVKGSDSTLERLGGGEGPYILSYRRYANGVMMPMRLDITVSSAGRVMAINARSVPDPHLPEPKLDKSAAKRRAEELSGIKASDDAFVIAQELSGTWVPVWIVNLIRDGETEPSGAVVYLDAVTGMEVQRQE
ncbi:VanZ family protein [Streptomyces sp. NPDC047515]|uniref:VanZ family protein n=1 Tax=Streptomyces sp. NPDC047515 TaxID=3155380 RepID=UPI0033D1A233